MSVRDEGKIPMFDGDRKSYHYWRMKFVARAVTKGYDQVLLGFDSIPLDPAYVVKAGSKVKREEGEVKEQEKEKPLTEEQKKILKLNRQAYADLITAIDVSKPGGPTAMNIVARAKSDAYPTGNAYDALGRLDNKYLPTTTCDLSDLLMRYHSAVSKPGANADNFITSLEDLRSKLEHL